MSLLKPLSDQDLAPLEVVIEHSGFRQQILIQQKPTSLRIYDAVSGEGCIEESNTFIIPVNTQDLSKVRSYSLSKKWIIWDCSHISFSEEFWISFIEKIWTPSSSFNIGVLLYRGALFSPSQEEILEPLQWCLSQLPEKALPFLWLDLPSGLSATSIFQRLSGEDFEPFIPIIRGEKLAHFPYAVRSLTWGISSPLGSNLSALPSRPIPLIFLISSEGFLEEQESLLQQLHEKNILFRVVGEHAFTHQWDGADFALVLSQAVTPQTRRKLKGFCAAGGTVVVTGELLGVGSEMPLNEFLEIIGYATKSRAV